MSLPKLPNAALFLLLGLGASEVVAAQTFTVLHSFSGTPDGASPQAAVIIKSGSLYGTTLSGGVYGSGTVFKLDKNGNESVLHSFGSTTQFDGAYPYAGLTRGASGNLFGTTYYGGTSTADAGTIFRLDKTGKETVLYSFMGQSDGGYPNAGLVSDSLGNLYGTVTYGGLGYQGGIFLLTPGGSEAVIYRFTGSPDAGTPYASLIRDSAGNLYGTTINGGAFHSGAVFKLDPANKETVLYSFAGGTDGANPYANVIRNSGNFYGTTAYGGTSNLGTVFKLDKDGKETVLHSFAGGTDGAHPYTALIRDPAGNLYGTTTAGGASNSGTIFKVDKTGKETVLYSFKGGNDGGQPYAALVRDSVGNLYGTASSGGKHGFGVVFKLTP